MTYYEKALSLHLIARDADPEKMCVMTVGKFQAGAAAYAHCTVQWLEAAHCEKDVIRY